MLLSIKKTIFFPGIFFQCSQVGEVIRALGQNPTEADIRRLMQSQKADGRVAFDTFLPILHAVSQKQMTDTVDDFVEGLRHFDKVRIVLGDPLFSREWSRLLGGPEPFLAFFPVLRRSKKRDHFKIESSHFMPAL